MVHGTRARQSWNVLEKLFLARFFEDDSEVAMTTLLATIQRKDESIKDFTKRFRNMDLKCPNGMTQQILVQTCRHNFQPSLLAQIGAVECTTWKQLKQHREHTEEIVARIRMEVGKRRPKLERPPKHPHEQSF